MKRIFKNASKKTRMFAGLAALVAVVSIPTIAIAGYGPNGDDRKVFDYKNSSQNGGSFDGPRFNSFINTDVYGDERAFFDAKECAVNGAECYKQGQSGGYKDVQTVTPGKEYLVRAYVHNIANPSTNDDTSKPGALDGIGVAKNTRVRIELPTGVANGFTMQARITADNALPREVYDTVDFKNDSQSYSISYVPGSAYIFNASHPDGHNLSDDIVSGNGALIGMDTMDGVIPGCFEYSSFVVVRVVVNTPKIEIDKFVSKDTMPTMAQSSESITVNRGDTVSWRINYKNSGSDVAQNIVVRDELPAGLEIVPGSIVLSTAAGNETLNDSALGSGGVDVGDYFPEGNGVIRFSTKVNTDPTVCEVKNVAFASAHDVQEVSDDAKIVINNCAPKSVICESLTASKYAVRPNETVVFTAKAVAVNTLITGYDFSINDVKGGVSTENTLAFTTSTIGSYFVRVHILTEDGQRVTSDDCVKSVTVEEEPVIVCETLTADKLTLKIGEKSQLMVKDRATEGVTISGYVFAVNGKEAQNSTSDTFIFEAKEAGSYQIIATIKSTTGDVTSDSCVKIIDVVKEEKPIYRCDAFTLSKNKVVVAERFTATARITAKDGVTFKQATFSFGDEKNPQDKFVTNKIVDGVITVDHAYTKGGDYAPRVKIDFEDKNGKLISVEDPACIAQIHVADVKGVTTTLPKTGAGSFAGVMVALTAAGTALHRKITLRKS